MHFRSGDWFYQFSEVIALILTVGAVVLTFKTYVATYDKKMDSFGGSKFIPADFAGLWIFLPALVMALVCTLGHYPPPLPPSTSHFLSRSVTMSRWTLRKSAVHYYVLPLARIDCRNSPPAH